MEQTEPTPYRDPERIDTVLDLFEDLWRRHRFLSMSGVTGLLTFGGFRPPPGRELLPHYNGRTYGTEDSDLVQGLRHAREYGLRAGAELIDRLHRSEAEAYRRRREGYLEVIAQNGYVAESPQPFDYFRHLNPSWPRSNAHIAACVFDFGWVWKLQPDQRFGQMVANFARRYDSLLPYADGQDDFTIESNLRFLRRRDEDLLRAL